MNILVIFLTFFAANFIEYGFAGEKLVTLTVPYISGANLGFGFHYEVGRQLGISQLVFPEDDINKNKQSIDQTYTYFNMDIIESKRQRLEFLGISGGASIYHQSNGADPSHLGIKGSFIDSKESQHHVIEAMVYIQQIRGFDTLRSMSDMTDKCQNADDSRQKYGTHVVRSIKRGAEMIASLRFEFQNQAEKNNIMGNLTAAITKTKVSGTATGNLDIIKESLDSNLKISKLLVTTPEYRNADLSFQSATVPQFIDEAKNFLISVKHKVDNNKIEMELVPLAFTKTCKVPESVLTKRSLQFDFTRFNIYHDDVTKANEIRNSDKGIIGVAGDVTNDCFDFSHEKSNEYYDFARKAEKYHRKSLKKLSNEYRKLKRKIQKNTVKSEDFDAYFNLYEKEGVDLTDLEDPTQGDNYPDFGKALIPKKYTLATRQLSKGLAPFANCALRK